MSASDRPNSGMGPCASSQAQLHTDLTVTETNDFQLRCYSQGSKVSIMMGGVMDSTPSVAGTHDVDPAAHFVHVCR